MPTRKLRLLTATALLVVTPALAQNEAAPKRPNFLVIVADDLGYSDIGAFGSEIQTPNLDALAMSGLRLANFHTSPACSPTRAMLLTGSDSHRVGLGAMEEAIPQELRGKPGYEGSLRTDVPTLAELLSAAGYRTMLSGKWHLGRAPAQDPHMRGFQHSFTLLNGGANHFSGGYDPEKPIYTENGRRVSRLPTDFYSSDYFADKLIQQIKDSKSGNESKKPFFAYLAFTAPHFPLHAPQETIAKYRGRYDTGFEVLREQRLKRQRELGLLEASVQPHPMDQTPKWEELSAQERQLSARNREVYSAMVDRMDTAVGRVMAALKETGEFDNTVILFLSDNGADGMDLRTTPVYVGRRYRVPANIQEIGSVNSFTSIGPGWAHAASAPFSRFKANATEGGTRAVAFLSGPVVRQHGTITQAYMNVTDVVPTFLDLAGVPLSQKNGGSQKAYPLDGLSWVPFLKNGGRVYPGDKEMGTSIGGGHTGRAVWLGDWKLIDIDGQWNLYNLVDDPGETRDLSREEPTRMQIMLEAWHDYAQAVGFIPNSQLTAEPVSKTQK